MKPEDNKKPFQNATMFPDLVDNIEGNTLASALKTIFTEHHDISEVCIATAFFTSAGFFHIGDELTAAPSVRILIGAEFFSKNLFTPRPIGETEKSFQKKQLQNSLSFLEKKLWEERNHLPFSLESEKRIKNFVKALKARNIEIRRYEKNFLHAKAYIFIKGEGQKKRGEVVVGSSNMTKAGLTTNLELNVSRSDKIAVAEAKNWFDSLWKEATPWL